MNQCRSILLAISQDYQNGQWATSRYLFICWLVGWFIYLFIVLFPLTFIPFIPLCPTQSLHCCLFPWLLFPFCFCKTFLKYFTYLFLDRGEGKEKEKDRNINVWLPLACPRLETWLATQACALTGNRTGNPLVCKPALNPLSHSSRGLFPFCLIPPPPNPPSTPQSCQLALYLCLSLFCLLVQFIRFHIWVKSYICLSLTGLFHLA